MKQEQLVSSMYYDLQMQILCEWRPLPSTVNILHSRLCSSFLSHAAVAIPQIIHQAINYYYLHLLLSLFRLDINQKSKECGENSESFWRFFILYNYFVCVCVFLCAWFFFRYWMCLENFCILLVVYIEHQQCSL